MRPYVIKLDGNYGAEPECYVFDAESTDDARSWATRFYSEQTGLGAADIHVTYSRPLTARRGKSR